MVARRSTCGRSTSAGSRSTTPPAISWALAWWSCTPTTTSWRPRARSTSRHAASDGARCTSRSCAMVPSWAPGVDGSGRCGSLPRASSRSTRRRSARPNWFEHVGAEHRAVRERVGLIDQTSFAKFELTGPGSLDALQWLSVCDMDKPVGSVIYTQFCNERGGIECDLTVTRLASDRWYLVTGAAFGAHDMGWVRQQIAADGRVLHQRRHLGSGCDQPVRATRSRGVAVGVRRGRQQRRRSDAARPRS